MPAPFFRIEMLPARLGDCLWVEYGEGDDVRRLLIDGGPVSTFEAIEQRIGQMPMDDRVFELVVLSHVDADHVEGLVRLFAETPLPVVVDKVWFNGWRQMKKSHGLLGALEGEFLSALLVHRAPAAWAPDAPPWVVSGKGSVPSSTLPGGMKITLLSPNPASLQKMAKAWRSAIEKSGIPPGNLAAAWKLLGQKRKFLPRKGLLGAAPDLDRLLRKQFMSDQAIPNGSSIAFLAEYEGKSALFLADAHPGPVVNSIKRLCAERGIRRLPVSAVKVSHHGSKGNTSEALLKIVESPRYLISTNGDQFKHPNKECVARILKIGKPDRLYFNYRSSYTKPWLDKAAEERYRYKAVVRAADDPTLRVEL